MGGTTITRYGKTEEEVLAQLKEQVLLGREVGLFPDSAAVLIKGDDLVEGEVEKTKAKLFKVSDEGEFTETDKGRIFHVGMSARFSKRPEPGEILGTLHLHT